MNDACGSDSRRLRASPSIKSYWLRCASSAITTMFRRSERSWRFPAFLFRHDFLDGGEDHATARDIEQLAQMLDRVRLHRV